MRPILRALLLAVALVPLLADADSLTWPTVRVGKGYAGPVVVSVTQDGAARDMSSATGTLTVYSTPPSGGAGGMPLFTKTLAVGGTTGTMTASVSAADTAVPGAYYAEISITQGAITDTWHGTIVIEGR